MTIKNGWLAMLILALVLLAATYLRVANLGGGEYQVDELFQYYAALGILESGVPLLPSGELYLRGIDVTRLVAISIDIFGPEQAAVRLPSAFLGTANLVVFAGILWVLAGPWAAVWGSVLLGLYPEAVYQSRYLRFYTYQLMFGLFALFLGWLAVKQAGSKLAPARRDVLRQWALIIATILAFLLGTRVQIVTLSVAAGWGVCVLWAALADCIVRGWTAWRTSPPLQAVALGVVVATLTMIVQPELILGAIRRSQSVADWALAAGTGGKLSYYYALTDSYRIVVALSPAIFLFLALRRPRLSLYLGTWFAVPVVLHSFVFPWKGERFILLAVPALFAAAAITAAWASAAIYRKLKIEGDVYVGRRFSRLGAGFMVAIISIGAVITTRAFSESRKMVFEEGRVGWLEASEILASNQELQELPAGAFGNLHPFYYWERLDFHVGTLPPESEQGQSIRQDAGVAADDIFEEHNPYTGLPVMGTPKAIREKFRAAGAVILALQNGRDYHPELLEVLNTEATELCEGRCRTIQLYYWSFQNEESVWNEPLSSRLAASAPAGRLMVPPHGK